MKSISKTKAAPKGKAKRAAAPTMYRVLVTGQRLNVVAAALKSVQQVYELPAAHLKDTDHAKREALRLAAREHPSWRDTAAVVMGA